MYPLCSTLYPLCCVSISYVVYAGLDIFRPLRFLMDFNNGLMFVYATDIEPLRLQPPPSFIPLLYGERGKRIRRCRRVCLGFSWLGDVFQGFFVCCLAWHVIDVCDTFLQVVKHISNDLIKCSVWCRYSIGLNRRNSIAIHRHTVCPLCRRRSRYIPDVYQEGV